MLRYADVKTYHDIVGDGGSRVAEQVGELRSRIAARLAGVRHRVAVGSGKGGVGKSTLTWQLASALRRNGASVAVLDADINGPSQARLAGMHEVPFVPTADGVALSRNRDGIGVVSLGSLVPEGEAVDFDNVSKGESHTWRATREFSAMAELLAAVEWGELDHLLVDLPPGAERTFQYAEFLGEQTSFVLVGIPSDLARGVVTRSVAALRKTPNRVLGYVENMSGYYCSECDDVRPLFPETGDVNLGIPCLGRIPFDPELASISDSGESVAEARRPALRAVAEIAESIHSTLEKPR
ncbi:MAG: Mrp/NBP35 family ATP-binding protein [bacterium]|nr:Mrp/NBP35 family ATP-binding protein [bacterium]